MTFTLEPADDTPITPALPGQYVSVKVQLPDGLRQVADVSFQRAHWLASALAGPPDVEPAFPGRLFLNEFPVRVKNVLQTLGKLDDVGILGGLPAGRWYPDLDDVIVLCCTELNDPRALEQLVEALR